MTRHVFNVFGRLVAIERVDDRWTCWQVGSDGKRGPIPLAIPAELARGELAQYLYDIYHERATPTNGDVVEVADTRGSSTR